MVGGGATPTPTSKGNKYHHSNPKIVLAIRSQDGESWYYRIEKEKKIQRLLMIYCSERNVKYDDVAFIYNGARLQSTLTLNQLGMEDGDEIDAMLHQTGGGYLY